MRKPKLVPVSAPWQISPSVSAMTLRAAEDGEEPATVVFIGHFGKDDHGSDLPTEETPDRVGSSAEFEPWHGERGESHHLVRVTFVHCLCVRMMPPYAEYEVIPESQYDWSAVEAATGSDNGVQDIEQFLKIWSRESNCPDPSMYEVLRSRWKRELEMSAEGDKLWTHYLMVGSECSIEVMAQGWQWEKGQPA